MDKIYDFFKCHVSGAKNIVNKIRSKVNNLAFMPSGLILMIELDADCMTSFKNRSDNPAEIIL